MNSAASVPQPVKVGARGSVTTVSVFDSRGAAVRELTLDRERTVLLPSGGFLIAER